MRTLAPTRHTPRVDPRRVAEEALHACVRLQRANVQWIAGLRTGVLVLLALLAGLALGRLTEALSVAVGLLFIAIADVVDSRAERLRAMLWATLWVGGAVLLGGLVGDFPLLHVVVAVILALLCGYSGALGPRAGLVGVLALVLFAFYAGSPVVVDVAFIDAGFFVLGGLITVVVNILTTPPSRLGATRSAVAHVYRELQDAASRRGLALAAPAVATAAMAAHGVADRVGCAGDTRAWVDELLAGAEDARLALLALLSERDIDPAYVDELTTTLREASGAIADELAAPLGLPGRSRRDRARQRLADLRAAVDRAPDPRLADLGADLVSSLARAVTALDGPWPLGSRVDLAPPAPRSAPVLARLRAHLDMTDPVAEHAVRLAVAFGGATLAAVMINVSHAYWVPLTVAWIAKPDLANTVSRVAMRIVGTLAGLVMVTAILAATDLVPGQAVILCLAVGIAAGVVLAYLGANYPLAVLGITCFVLLIEHLTGDGEEYDILARLAATVIAGLWVLLVASVRPRRTGSTAVTAMRGTLDALQDYARLARDGQDTTAVRARVLAERTAALAAVSAATLETPGIFERAGDRIDPVQAEAVISDIIRITSTILAQELLVARGEADPSVWSRIESELSDLGARVDAVRIDTISA